MKAFNKLFSLVVASVLVFSLAGCGDKEESKKFSAILKPKFNLPPLVQPPKKMPPGHLSR